MGWDAEQIVPLFHDPFYPALNGLVVRTRRGWDSAASRRRCCGGCAVSDVTATVSKSPNRRDVAARTDRTGNRTRSPGTAQEGSHAQGL